MDAQPVTGDHFPGSLCHNHASPFTLIPRRDDWTKLCDTAWTEEEKKDKCFSFQEASFGVDNLQKLEEIHSAVDSNHLFQCWDCVGYSSDEDKKSNIKKGGGKKKKKKKSDDYEHHPLYCTACGDLSMIGDGNCDEMYNNAKCQYDGGDCN